MGRKRKADQYKSICGRPGRQTGQPCGRPAGWGTDHPGDGPCKFHGGKTGRGPKNLNFRHGLRSKFWKPEDVEAFADWQERSGTQRDRLSEEDEYQLYRLEMVAANFSDETSARTRAEVLDKIADIRLKAQKLRGGEKPQEVTFGLTPESLALMRQRESDDSSGDQ